MSGGDQATYPATSPNLLTKLTTITCRPSNTAQWQGMHLPCYVRSRDQVQMFQMHPDNLELVYINIDSNWVERNSRSNEIHLRIIKEKWGVETHTRLEEKDTYDSNVGGASTFLLFELLGWWLGIIHLSSISIFIEGKVIGWLFYIHLPASILATYGMNSFVFKSWA